MGVLVDQGAAAVDQVVGVGQVCDDLVDQRLKGWKTFVGDGGSSFDVGGQLLLQINWVEATGWQTGWNWICWHNCK